jgi:hypothetical protein
VRHHLYIPFLNLSIRIATEYQEKIDQYVEMWRKNKYYVIGLQIRGVGTPYGVRVEKFITCGQALAKVSMEWIQQKYQFALQ